ncbi:MAG: hypothetical protein JWM91_2836, partial [Rhodospirillales bacterium]|nr:hypothetical protein [Rhodospirillales bacterium]
VGSDNAYPLVDVILEKPPPELLSKAEAAAEYCPNGVITIVYETDGRDPPSLPDNLHQSRCRR